jgi:hypothetical protein
MPQLRDTLHQMNKDIIPKATFIVNSGTGLHLYYVLTEPVPMYPHNQKILKELKYSLTRQIHRDRVKLPSRSRQIKPPRPVK